MQLFAVYGIDAASRGARIFALLVDELIDGQSVKKAMRTVCEVYGLPRAAAYTAAKRALAPVFDEPETLQSYGLQPAKTVPELARQIAAYALLLRDGLTGYARSS